MAERDPFYNWWPHFLGGTQNTSKQRNTRHRTSLGCVTATYKITTLHSAKDSFKDNHWTRIALKSHYKTTQTIRQRFLAL